LEELVEQSHNETDAHTAKENVISNGLWIRTTIEGTANGGLSHGKEDFIADI
jgi:hypothetical protein